MIYGHGDDLYKYKGLVKANFSTNIYQKADLSILKKYLAGRLDAICNYPEPAPLSLEKALACEQGISEDEVTVTNGATEAIYIIAENNARKYGNDGFTNVIKQPTFSEYADACRMSGSRTVSDKEHTTGRKVYWLCNPNNPTGHVLPSKTLLDMADNNPEVLFVIDQSYEHYTHEKTITDREAVIRNNIILLHSMTKRFCVPGLRLGYAVANVRLSDELKHLRHPWSVNALAIEAGMFLISNRINFMPDLDSYLEEAQRLHDRLSDISDVSVNDTQTNFMLAKIEGHTAAELKDFLVTKYGLLIRDASNFEGLTPSHFRVAAQDKQADDELVAAIKTFTKSVEKH